MKTFGFAVALCALAGAAQAVTLTAYSIETGAMVWSSDTAVQFGPRADTVVYSHMNGPYAAFAAANYLGFDDYATAIAAPTISLNSLRFVGGVTAANTTVSFNFYNSAGTVLLNSFTSTFATAGNFIWSITNLGGFNVGSSGVLELQCETGKTGQWFLSTSATTVGGDSRTFGDTTTTNQHSFELAIPAPGSLALLGLGGLVAGRRRR
ncbi:MAG: PEP-CTERM sorting domain-containing protein [Planctomycetota bacterium]|nr:PEP-CTERM sorting domain-containing protein [Planctomycetota bacterium]